MQNYLIKTEATVDHAFVVMSEAFLPLLTIIVNSAGFSPVLRLDNRVILPRITYVLKNGNYQKMSHRKQNLVHFIFFLLENLDKGTHLSVLVKK